MFPILAIVSIVLTCFVVDGPAVTLTLIGMLLSGWTMQNLGRA